jgi:hypothetical protein
MQTPYEMWEKINEAIADWTDGPAHFIRACQLLAQENLEAMDEDDLFYTIAVCCRETKD